MKIDLSVVILSFNTKELTRQCLSSLIQSLERNKKLKSEIIVVDNGSADGSVVMLEKTQNSKLKAQSQNLKLKTILNRNNLGYPKGNNQALRLAQGKYILFLNSDVIIKDVDFEDITEYLERNPDVGALTVKVLLPSEELDPASHRGFPTIWNSFCYFTGLESILKPIPFLNKIFGGYHLIHLGINSTHEIDSPSGAFYLVRGDAVKALKGFDEQFFMYGEDLDLSYRIKKSGYKIIYYPHFSIIHLKHASGLQQNNSATRSSTKRHFFKAMNIFYRKHYEKKHARFVNSIVYRCINLLEQIS